MWIYEDEGWPNFVWCSERLSPVLARVRYHQGHLLGRMQDLGFVFTDEAHLHMLTKNVVTSSAIEGEYINPEEVRSSIARRLGIEFAGLVPVSRDVEGIVEMMLDASQAFDEPLTKERLWGWHAALFPTGHSNIHRITVGAWRTIAKGAMQVVSGPIGKEKIHFEAPNASLLEDEMQDFLDWFNGRNGENSLDPVLKAGIAHLWFVTLHPFEDGNGRIARAVADMALARADGISRRFYSMSSQIEMERKDYYKELEFQQRGTLDITDWLSWFLECLDRAILHAEILLSHVLFKAKLWDKVKQDMVNARQTLVLNRMLEDNFEGYMNTSKYAKLAKCSKDTALRDIQVLKTRGVFIQNSGGGRSVSYRLPLAEEL